MTILVNDTKPTTDQASPEQAESTQTSEHGTPPGPEPSKGPWSRVLGSAIVLTIGAAILLAVYLYPAAPAQEPERTGPPSVHVKTRPIEAKPQRNEVRLPAVLQPYRTVRIAAEVDGRVEKLGPPEGSEIEPNQPLVWLNADLLQALHDQVKAKHDLDVRELARYEDLDSKGVATDIELFRARAAAAISKASLEEVSERLKRTVIRSSIGGVLNDLLVEPGEFVGGGNPVAEVFEMDRLKAVVNVPERDVLHFKLGQTVRVVVEAAGGLELKGTISFIDNCGDEVCRTFRTEITIDNKDRLARAGLIARVVLLRDVVDDAIMIPLTSVIPTQDGYQVYVVEDGLARSRPVTIGMIVGDQVQAKTGLAHGDRLIVDGHRLVGDGSPVTIVE